MKRVAIQGHFGSFHDQAAQTFYLNTLGYVPQIIECPNFASLYTAMADDKADSAIMAIENTISGGLLPNFELLRQHEVSIKGEVYLAIHQNLMALPGQKIEDIREIRTHYMAINQTRKFFEENCPWIQLVESEDTAASAIEIAKKQLRGVGAVASTVAAQQNNLEILAAGIETYKDNFTRFLILDNQMELAEDQIDKASICFTLPHKPGSLAHILAIMSFYEMNLTRIQSLPIPGKKWQYFFYIDIKFDSCERYRQALSAVRPLIDDLKILGEYKAAI